MDHRPFEDWLLEDQPLNPEQKRQLNTHLRACASCASLAEVNLALKSVNMATPAAGFSDRFQVRLTGKKQALRWRNFWGFALLTLSVLGIFVWGSWPVLKDLFQSPVNFLSAWASSLVSFWASVQAIAQAGLVLVKVAPGFVPAYVWAVLLFATGGSSMVWVVSLMKFTKVPQGV
jgi:hypothetical protein